MFHKVTYGVLLLAATGFACGGENPPAGPGTNPPPPPPPNTVEVANNYFNPVSLTVPVGTTVTWDWPVVSRRHNILPHLLPFVPKWCAQR